MANKTKGQKKNKDARSWALPKTTINKMRKAKKKYWKYRHKARAMLAGISEDKD